jgi:hypothetical protein
MVRDNARRAADLYVDGDAMLAMCGRTDLRVLRLIG